MWRTWLPYFIVVVALVSATEATNITVTGVSTGIDLKTHQRPTRRNIRELFSEAGPQWDLYILALSAFQAVDEADDMSYFQITGIHGRPFDAWNNVDNVPGAPEEMGYCPHGEMIFGTWHRPYLALFEQALVSHAVNISNQYPPDHAPAYKGAAQTLRLPFWDWADDPTVPDFTGDTNITVNGPTGLTTIRNPLYSYRFQNPVPSSWGGGLSKYRETVRCAGTDGSVNNLTLSNQKMMSAGPHLKSSVYDAFIRSTKFEDVACSGCGGPNFEDPHSTVHTTVGCGGTMTDIVLSAFDPLFMLHHCNVDRLLAMWQAINYEDDMFDTTSTSYGQFGTPGGSKITRDSPLKPFRMDPNAFHTSNLVTNISTFGYTYPEIYDWDTSPNQSRAFVITQVNMLYGPSSTYDRSKSFPNPQKHSSVDNKDKYYIANVQLDRSEVPLPAVIELAVNGTTVGTLALLAMPSQGNMSTSVPVQDPRLAGLVDLNMDSQAATSVLQQGLTVDIRHNGDTLVPVNTVPSLSVELQVIEYTPNSEKSQFPRLGDATRLPIAIRQGQSKSYR